MNTTRSHLSEIFAAMFAELVVMHGVRLSDAPDVWEAWLRTLSSLDVLEMDRRDELIVDGPRMPYVLDALRLYA